MLKRLFTLLLVAAIIMGLATGCTITGGSKTEPKDSGKAQTQAKDNFNEVGYPIVDKPITVTAMYAPNPNDGKPEEMSYWKKMEEITNIHIEWKMITSSDENAVQLFFAAGDLPDFLHSEVYSEEQFQYGVEGGMFADYSKLINKYMPNMVSWFKEFPQAEKVIKQINGEIYTLPRIQVASTSAYGQMFFRTDYLEKLGLKTPATTDEFYKALVAIKNANLTKGYAPLLPYNVNHLNNHIEPFLFAAFGSSVDADFADNGSGKVVYNRISDQYKRYLEFMNRLYKEKLLENELFTVDTATTLARIKAGQAAFMSTAHNLMETDFPDGKIHLDCLAPLTSENTNVKKVKAYPYVRSIAGATNKNTKYLKELMRMFDINYAKDEVVPGSGLNSLSQNLGLKGIDWDYTNSEKTAYAFKIPKDWNESIWDYVNKYVTWSQQYSACILMATSGSGNSLARETGMMKNNIPFAVVPFPDSSMKYSAEESNKIANKLTDIENYVTQQRARFISGVEPLSNWDAYVKKVEEMGIKEVIAVKQVVYDRWNAK